jgi:CO/xanthine dehydrogenase Mo-binding subunit
MGNLDATSNVIPRREGAAKVTGAIRYVDDLPLNDFLWGATVRSTIPHGKILSIHFDPSFDWRDFTIVTAQDIPGPNFVPLLEKDQPVLAEAMVRHLHEPIILLAHRDRAMLDAAKRHVRIDYEPLPAIIGLDEALLAQTPIFGQDNLFKKILIEKGELAKAIEAAHEIFSGVYETGHQEQVYLENQGMVAHYDQAQRHLKITGSMQCPYYVQDGVKSIMQLPDERVEIEQAATGGGFGGKEEYPTLIAAHAALLSLKSGKTVKLVYDRHEDMLATTKRHPARVTIRTALDGRGSVLGHDIDLLMDGGAYCTLSPVVLSRAAIHAAGPYAWENVRVRARSVATHTPPNGAFRGFGAPQSIFAIERHLDRLAKHLHQEPHKLRKRYLLRSGQTTATGQRIDDPAAADVLQRAVAKTNFARRRKILARENLKSRWERRGIGMALFFHGAGFTGSGEVYLASKVKVDATAEGKIRVFTANTEMGQGKDTIFAQIAADAMNVSLAQVEIVLPNTSLVPNSGPSVASRTAMVVGKLVHDACEDLKKKLTVEFGKPYKPAHLAKWATEYLQRHDALEGWAQYQPPPGVLWDDKNYRGAAYGTYAWACYVAEVTVALDTFEVKVDRFHAVQEIGKALNPVLAQGQIEGGVVQALGYALCEEVKTQNGGMINANLTNYIIPSFVDVPPVEVEFIEHPYAYGPFGAKGIGELPMDGPAPAVVNAICHALDIDVCRIPATPEWLCKIYKA